MSDLLTWKWDEKALFYTTYTTYIVYSLRITYCWTLMFDLPRPKCIRSNSRISFMHIAMCIVSSIMNSVCRYCGVSERYSVDDQNQSSCHERTWKGCLGSCVHSKGFILCSEIVSQASVPLEMHTCQQRFSVFLPVSLNFLLKRRSISHPCSCSKRSENQMLSFVSFFG